MKSGAPLGCIRPYKLQTTCIRPTYEVLRTYMSSHKCTGPRPCFCSNRKHAATFQTSQKSMQQPAKSSQNSMHMFTLHRSTAHEDNSLCPNKRPCIHHQKKHQPPEVRHQTTQGNLTMLLGILESWTSKT